MLVVESRPRTCEAVRFTGDNIDEVRKAVEFTGHKFRKDIPFGQNFYVDVRPGVNLTVVKGEWLVYNLSDATWRVFSDKEFERNFMVSQ